MGIVATGFILLPVGGCHAYQRYFIDRFYGPDDCRRIDERERRIDHERPQGERDDTQWVKPVTSGEDDAV